MSYETNLTDARWQIIAEYIEDGRKRKYSLRNIVEAILYLVKIGCQQRYLSADFPNWQVVDEYFRKFETIGLSRNHFRHVARAGGRVVVPTTAWKLIIVLPKKGTNDVSRVTTTRLVTTWLTNQQGIRNNDWKTYRVSVDFIEQQISFDFFSNVSAAVQNLIEARIDNQ